MQNTNVLYGVVGLVLGGLIVTGVCMANHHRKSDDMSRMQGTMDSMMVSLTGKTGDDFDKAFIKEMIVHHEGAVDMAEMARTSAKHEEIKTMANAIISAQTSEINQMKAWLEEWYGEDYQAPASSVHDMH